MPYTNIVDLIPTNPETYARCNAIFLELLARVTYAREEPFAACRIVKPESDTDFEATDSSKESLSDSKPLSRKKARRKIMPPGTMVWDGETISFLSSLWLSFIHIHYVTSVLSYFSAHFLLITGSQSRPFVHHILRDCIISLLYLVQIEPSFHIRTFSRHVS